MDAVSLIDLIPSLGFPIVCVIAMAIFIVYIVKTNREDNRANMETVQNKCAEREAWLQNIIKEANENNAKFANIIAKYDSKLDKIQEDVSEIKTDIIEIKANNK